MSTRTYLETASLKDIAKYDNHPDLIKKCVAFSGAPRKHPYDKEKLLLIIDPFSSNTFFYEFIIKDILHIEDIPGIATDSGENLTMARLWVRKGSFGIKYEPFEVHDPPRFMKDSELLHQVMNKSN